MRHDPLVDKLIELAILEDLSLGDVTTEATVDPAQQGVGTVRAKEDLVLAGTAVATRVFARVDPDIKVCWERTDGAQLSAGEVVGLIHGRTHSLLKAERTALNFLQRLSGTATLTRRFVDAVAGTTARVVDTRKTTPGWRTIQKAAVRAGGGVNHRLSLGAGVLIKDNHIDSGGGVKAAITAARAYAPHSLRVEIEVRNLAELEEAIAAGADIALLDNMTAAQLKTAAGRCRAEGVISEASGGVTLQTVRAVAETGVDLISVGALTHSAMSVDLNMKVRPVEGDA